LEGQWEQKRLQDHKNRICRAEPRIDFSTPASASYQHIRVGYPCCVVDVVDDDAVDTVVVDLIVTTDDVDIVVAAS